MSSLKAKRRLWRTALRKLLRRVRSGIPSRANGDGKMTTPSGRKRDRSFVGGLIPLSSWKTSGRAERGTKKDHFYRPLPKEFRRGGFNYRQIARESNVALYEQHWSGCAEPSVCYEVILIRRRDGFQISEKFIEPYEVYPKSDAWGANGFTVTDRNEAWDKFFEISLEEPALRGRRWKNGKIV